METKQEKLYRKFLLGDVSKAEREAIEDGFLADEENFVALEIVEDELIEDYLRGDLGGAEKNLFEAAFLQTAARRERVESVKILLDETRTRKRAVPEKSTFGETVAAFFRKPMWQISFAALILLTAFGAWFVFRQGEKTPEIVKAEPEVSPAPVSSPEIIAPPNSNLPIINENKPTPTPKPSPTLTPEKSPTPMRETVLAIFILKPGGIRGTAENLLRITPQTDKISLRLDLEANNYSSYTARVTTVDGTTVFTSARLKSNKKSVQLNLPVRRLSRGDYIVELSGITATGQTESVDDYVFTIQK